MMDPSQPDETLNTEQAATLALSVEALHAGLHTELSNAPFLWPGEGENASHAYLMLHGLGGGVYEMKPIAHALHKMGYTVQGINFPGHETSAFHMPSSRWQEWYGHILETYRELRRTGADVSIVGFSTGATLGLHLAANEPVRELILLSPFFQIRHRWFYGLRPEFYVRTLSRIIKQVPRFRYPLSDRALMKQVSQLALYQSFNISSVKSALELIKQVESELPMIESPVLMIQSIRDSIVCPSGVDMLKVRLGSQEKHVHWLVRSDHVITLDVERNDVVRFITQFCKRPQPQLASLES